jgi:hypothetical protein
MTLRLYENNLPIQLEYFVESAKNDIDVLREAEKASREKVAVDVLFKNALNSILKVVEKFEKPLDPSKGDIKKIVGHSVLLQTITELSNEYDPDQTDIQSTPVNKWGLPELIALSRKTYLYISNLSKNFAQGYRDNNILIINYYKALVSNLIALVGECVAYTINNEKVDYHSLRIITLKEFVEAYEKGSIHKFLDTSGTIMESYIDKNGVALYESYDIVQSSIQFIKRFISDVDKNGEIGHMIYKAVDFIKQILIIKQMVWPLVVNMLPKMSEYINLFKSFIGSAELATEAGSTNKIADQIISNSSRADDKANYLISIENNQMYNNTKKN